VRVDFGSRLLIGERRSFGFSDILLECRRLAVDDCRSSSSSSSSSSSIENYCSFDNAFATLLMTSLSFNTLSCLSDRATAACWRSSAKFADRGCRVVSATDSHGR
jgi:hypothetical protein